MELCHHKEETNGKVIAHCKQIERPVYTFWNFFYSNYLFCNHHAIRGRNVIILSTQLTLWTNVDENKYFNLYVVTSEIADLWKIASYAFISS